MINIKQNHLSWIAIYETIYLSANKWLILNWFISIWYEYLKLFKYVQTNDFFKNKVIYD